MKRKILFALMLSCIILPLSSCVKWQGALGMDTNLPKAVFKAVDKLLQNNQIHLAPDTSFLVASLVNINNLEQSSTFGRTLAEYIKSCLVQHGYTTSEIKLRQSLFIKEQSGEFLLSRDINEIGDKYNAQVVIVGSYSIGKYVVYVSLRLVETESNTILSATEFEIPLGAEVKKLLGNDSLF